MEIEFHKRIIDSLKRGDPDEAEAVMRAHIEKSPRCAGWKMCSDDIKKCIKDSLTGIFTKRLSFFHIRCSAVSS